MSKGTIHLIGLPYTESTVDYNTEPFTEQLRKFCKTAVELGYHIIYYGGFKNDWPDIEHIPVVGAEKRRRWFGTRTWPKERVFNLWSFQETFWAEYQKLIIDAMDGRIGPTDLIMTNSGACSGLIQAAYPANIVGEFGIGYGGPLASSCKVFESNAWRHYLYGKFNVEGGSFQDRVIPATIDPDEFPFQPNKGNDLLYLGRMTMNKGMQIIDEIAKKFDVITVGSGEDRVPNAKQHIDFCSNEKRAELLGSARAVLVPTRYIEPFGRVAYEAMMCGTPVITTDFGSFPEYVKPGTGIRCNSLREFLDAAEGIDCDPNFVRNYAMETFSLTATKPQYEVWLNDLMNCYGDGWYSDTDLVPDVGTLQGS